MGCSMDLTMLHPFLFNYAYFWRWGGKITQGFDRALSGPADYLAFFNPEPPSGFRLPE